MASGAERAALVKIVAAVRTLNERRNIAAFCRSYYQWVDEIIVADGGSEDDTVAIAKRFPNTRVIHFKERMNLEDGRWRNPQGSHFLMLRDEAIQSGADWIIFDDCDCVPNYKMKANARRLFEQTEQHSIFARRVYFWGSDRIFPQMHAPGASLWAWAPNRVEVTVDPEAWRSIALEVPPISEARVLEFPYCLLHRPWPDPETVDRKMEFYQKSGQHPNMKHPLNFAGPLAEPEPFMRVEP